MLHAPPKPRIQVKSRLNVRKRQANHPSNRMLRTTRCLGITTSLPAQEQYLLPRRRETETRQQVYSYRVEQVVSAAF